MHCLTYQVPFSASVPCMTAPTWQGFAIKYPKETVCKHVVRKPELKADFAEIPAFLSPVHLARGHIRHLLSISFSHKCQDGRRKQNSEELANAQERSAPAQHTQAEERVEFMLTSPAHADRRPCHSPSRHMDFS